MLEDCLAGQPKYRLEQIYRAWFDRRVFGYEQITTLPQDLREKLKPEPWLTVKLKTLQTSRIDGTKKALLELSDGACVETVLMGRENKKRPPLTPPSKGGDRPDERYTICISTQVGCPMGCAFCATGKMGFTRNLTAQEIIDQVRFWMSYPLLMKEGNKGWCKISNIVLMGQGEPFLNYENVKAALNIILKYAGLGPRQITVSTVGVPVMMEKMVADPEWPAVRFALSLHNPIEEERKKLIPSHQKDFLKFLVEWSKKYHERFSARAQFIGLEYTLVPGQNDSERHLKALIKLASKLGKVRINLIPLNLSPSFQEGVGGVAGVMPSAQQKTATPSAGSPLERGRGDGVVIDHWHKRLMECGFTTTIRRSQGADIAAACGQLALSEN